MEEFDPYCAWLGIPAGTRPPDHYQLLGLPAFQDDRHVISAAANHQLAQVKPHFGGPQASLALRLLNEIASAKELLLNLEAKASYDAELQRRQKAGPAFVAPPRKARMKDIPLLPPGVEAPPQQEAAPLAPPLVAAPPAPATAVQSAYAPAQVAAVPQAPAYPHPQAAYVPQQAMMAMPVAQPAMGYGAPYQQPAPYGYPQPYGQPMMPSEPVVSISRSRAPNRRRTSSTEMALAMLALCVVAVAGVAGFIVWRMQNAEATTDGDNTELATNDYSSSFTRKPIIAESRNSDSGTPRTAMEDLYPDTYKPGTNAAKTGNVGRPNSEDSMLGTPDPRTPMKKPDEMAKVEPPKRVEPPKKVEPKPAPPKTEPKKPEPPKTEPAKTATPAMPAKAPDPKETAAVNKGLGTARTAIKLRHFKDAADQLDLLELDGPSPQSMAEIEQVRALLHYNKEFWHAASESWKGLIAGNELMVNDETIVIVEASADKLIIRSAGQNRVFTAENMPASLALVLAEKWLKNEASSKAALGAFQSTDPKGDKKKGRDLLNQAAKEGIDVASVLKEIDRK